MNPTRSFDNYIKHLKLIDKILKHIWAKHEWYKASTIVESRVMKGLWMFFSYCETYRDDLALVNFVYVLLILIIQMFQNIINKSVKDKHKTSFKRQRMSMLPTSMKYAALSAPGGLTAAHHNKQTGALSCSDRHSIVSFVPETFDNDGMLSAVPSEAGSALNTTHNGMATTAD